MDSSVTNAQLLSLVETWVLCLAREDYEAAYRLTKHDPYYEWTPSLIEKVINGYGLPEPHPSGEIFKVTEPSKAKGEEGQREVVREKGTKKCIGTIFYDLPLNGEWSDLTATFRIEQSGLEVELVLEEIHVF